MVVDNDANCAAVAEQVGGAARGHDEALVVTLGTGIGAGIITGGQLLRGANGFAGEPGHMVVDPNGPPCPCGKRGCWERFASGHRARAARPGCRRRRAARGGRGPGRRRPGGGARRAGHRRRPHRRSGGARPWSPSSAHWIALGLANLVNVLDPAVIVIGGGLVEAADLLLPEVRTRFAELVMAGERRPVVPIVAAELGERAGAIGAALLAHADH